VRVKSERWIDVLVLVTGLYMIPLGIIRPKTALQKEIRTNIIFMIVFFAGIALIIVGLSTHERITGLLGILVSLFSVMHRKYQYFRNKVM